MKLKRIGYKSAVFFGVFALLYQLVVGVVNYVGRSVWSAYGVNVSAVNAIVTTPLANGAVYYIMALFVIWVYNMAAKKGYCISWETSKK